MLVWFDADLSGREFPGFTAVYSSTSTNSSAAPCADRGSALALPRSLTQGPATGGYANDSYCWWKFSDPENYNVRITFFAFDLEETKDFVRVFNGDSVNPLQIISTLTGSQLQLPTVVQSSVSALSVAFTSDSVTSRSGFCAYVDRIKPCTGVVTMTGVTGSFSDGSGSSGTLNATNCSWLIQPQSLTVKSIVLTLTELRFTKEKGDYSFVPFP